MKTPVYTIGYGARTIDEFIAALHAHGIQYLIDVRSRPYSRHKPDFSKEPLAQHLHTHGIRYVFMGDALGGKPDDPALHTDGHVDYAKVRQTAAYRSGIERLRDAWQQQLPVAVMCSEGKPETCHRSKLIGATLVAAGIDVAHIDEHGTLVTQADVALRSADGRRQPSLFDRPSIEQPSTDQPSPLPEPEPPPFDAAWYAETAASDNLDEAYDPYEPLDTPQPVAPKAPQRPLTLTEARTLLKQVFGFDEFRPLQTEVIENVLDRRDTLAIMPTGGGKSLCFQLPALMFAGLTVVVSPLISLMQDQVDQLRAWGVAAATLNSMLDYQTYADTVAQVRHGAIKILYMAPETLLRPDTLGLLARCQVDCLTIDEAHCISAWGHDFRPEYRQLIQVRRRLPDAVCIALTATATPRVRRDIKDTLEIDTADEYVASFDRENLFLTVRPRSDGLAQVLAFLHEHRDQSGVIYCATRKQVDELAAQLQANGWNARPYHAGLDDDVRQQHQRLFINDDVPIIVATVAFGMGIDKPDVRFVVHYNLPKNIESYYQEIGRAGRDGLPADCLLLLSYGDVQTIKYFIGQQHPNEQRGAIARLQALLRYAETAVCRRKPLLDYFGETYAADACDACDNCTRDEEALVDLTIPAQKFLSCVKRTGEIYGMSHVIDVLRGSRAQRILEKGHDQLSTYGIGRDHSKKAWQHMAQQFIRQGLLRQDPQYGSLKLTPQAYAVFKGETVRGTAVPHTAGASRSAVVADHDPGLFAQLRAKRKQIAEANGVPPYTIFHDRSLMEMATYFPHAKERFADIYGVGQAKVAQYAGDFLPLIRAYCAEHNLQEKPKGSAGAAPRPQQPIIRGVKPRTLEVAEAFNDGRSVSAIAADLGIKESTVLGHLWKYAQTQRPLRADGLADQTTLPPETQARVLAAFADLGADYLRPVYEALNETVAYDDLKVMRLIYVARQAAEEPAS